MKKRVVLISAVLLSVLLYCGCGKEIQSKDADKKGKVRNQYEINYNDPDITPDMTSTVLPQEIQVRNICKLATIEVYFHSVAKAVKPAASGLAGLNQADRRFWIEYSGYADVGIDMNKVEMTVTGHTVNVKIPHASLLGEIKVDSSSYDLESIAIESQSKWKAENSITAADVTKAIRESNSFTMLDILKDKGMMLTAEERAMDFIRKYIAQISAYSKINYTVNFEYIESDTK